jgi:hypothetical protein
MMNLTSSNQFHVPFAASTSIAGFVVNIIMISGMIAIQST